HVAGQSKLTAHTSRAASDRCDRSDRGTAQTHQHVGERLKPSGSRWEPGGVLDIREEVVVGQKVSLHRAVEDHDLDVLVRFERRNDFVQLRNGVRTEDVEGRMIERDSPIVWRAPCQMYLLRARLAVVALSGHWNLLSSRWSSKNLVDPMT